LPNLRGLPLQAQRPAGDEKVIHSEPDEIMPSPRRERWMESSPTQMFQICRQLACTADPAVIHMAGDENHTLKRTSKKYFFGSKTVLKIPENRGLDSESCPKEISGDSTAMGQAIEITIFFQEDSMLWRAKYRILIEYPREGGACLAH
jgi:hypothetical protein